MNHSYPAELLHTGYTVIDGTVFSMNGKYWMIYKDERSAAQTIYCSSTDDLGDTFRTCYDWQYMLLQRPVEGPLVFRDIHSDEYHIYVDHFSDHTQLAGHFTDLGYDHLIDWSDTEKLHLPEEEVRHGSVLAITQKE